MPREDAEEGITDRPFRTIMPKNILVIFQELRQLIVAEKPEPATVRVGMGMAEELGLHIRQRIGDGSAASPAPRGRCHGWDRLLLLFFCSAARRTMRFA